MADNAAKPVSAKGDALLGLAMIAFGIAMLFYIIPSHVNDAGSFGLAPSFAPRFLAWLIIGAGGVLTVSKLSAWAAPNGQDKAALTGANLMHLALSIGAAASTLILMKWVGDQAERPFMGFLLAAPLGLIAFTLLHRGAPIWAYVFNVVTVPLVIYAGIWWGLGIPMP